MRTIYIFGAVIVFGFNLLYLYPEYYEKLMITFSYNCIYYYSRFQIYYTKLNKLLTFVGMNHMISNLLKMARLCIKRINIT